MKTLENDLGKNQKKEEKVRNKKKYILTLLGTTLGVYLLMKYLLPLVVPFIFAYLIAAALLPLSRMIEKKVKIPKTITGGVLLILLLLLAGSFSFLIIKNLIEQITTLLTNLPVYQARIMDIVDSICTRCDGILDLMDGQSRSFFDNNMNKTYLSIQRSVLPSISQHSFFIAKKVLGFTGSIIFLIVATLLIINEADTIRKKYRKLFFYEDIKSIKGKLSDVGVAYFKAQITIMVIVACINVVGLSIIRNKYALLIGIAIALIDAFPFVGSGLVLWPWAVVSLFSKNVFHSAILMSIYLLCQVVRQVLEPKLIGDKIGINPLITIMAIYIGFEVYGIMGFILGPISIVLIRGIVEIIHSSYT